MNLTQHSMTVAGFVRDFAVHVPATKPKAAIICLHGGGGTGPEFLQEKWKSQADKDLVLVGPTALVSPTAGKTRWIIDDPAEAPTWPAGATGTTDYQYVEALCNWLKTQLGIDRVFVTGFSSGAKLTFGLVMNGLLPVAGFAPVSHGLPSVWEKLTPIRRGPLFYQFGTKDTHDESPYSLPYKQTFEWLESRWGETDPAVNTRSACRFTLRQYRYSSALLSQQVVQGEGHAWTQCRTYKTSDAIVDFFFGGS